MKGDRLTLGLLVGWTIVMGGVMHPTEVKARPVADNTLGSERSVVTPLLVSPGTDRIDGGAIRGLNLFHSFSRFNVDAGRIVNFANPNGIANIITRITGTDRSEILGELGVLGDANLFLLNPNGILFGKTASLNVNGSFIATTADAIRFPGGGEFGQTSSVIPNNNLLSINPSILWFNSLTPSSIQVRTPGNVSTDGILTGRIKVQPGKDLILLGGKVEVEGGFLQAPGGNLVLGGLAGPGEIRLGDRIQPLLFPIGVERADVTLSKNTSLSVASANKGSISIFANNFTMNDGSLLRAGIARGVGNATSQAGNIVIDAMGLVFLQDSGIFNSVALPNNSNTSVTTSGRGGDIIIRAKSLQVESSILSSSTFSQGNAGNILIQVSDNVILIDRGSLPTFKLQDLTYSLGQEMKIIPINQFYAMAATLAGNYINPELSAKLLRLQVAIVLNNQELQESLRREITQILILSLAPSATQILIPSSAKPQAFTRDVEIGRLSPINNRMNSSNDSITVNDKIVNNDSKVTESILNNLSVAGVFSTVEEGASGNAGNITIQSRSLTLQNGAQIQSLTRGEGNAGNIAVNSQDSITLSGVSPIVKINDITLGGFYSGFISATTKTAIGQGGNVQITTGTLSIADGAAINSSTRNATESGNIDINSNAVNLTNGSQLIANTSSLGKAGNITLNVTGNVLISGGNPNSSSLPEPFVNADVISNNGAPSGIFTDTDVTSSGRGGNITLSAGTINLKDAAQISTRSQGTGAAGDITFNVIDRITITDAKIKATAQSSGGNILGTAKTLRLEGNSDISTNVIAGTGGNITLTADSIVDLNDSDILAFARDGKGGNVTLNTKAFFGQNYRPATPGTDPRTLDGNDRVDINASGTISGIISLPDVSFIQNGLNQLPKSAIDTEKLVSQTCIVRKDKPQGTFYILGKTNLPQRPGDLIPSNYSYLESRFGQDPEI